MEYHTALSIIIVSFNTKELLRGCLTSIRRYLPRISCDTIVVDNASVDGSPEMVESEFPEVISIRIRSNLGFASANNIGIKRSRGKFLFFLNSDAELNENTISFLYDYLQRYPDVGVVGPANAFSHGLAYPTICPFPDLLFIFLTHTNLRRRYYLNPLINPYRRKWEKSMSTGQPLSVDWLSGAGMLVRRDVIAQTAGFDRDYFFYMEETDFCFRVWKNGWKVNFVPYAHILHHGGGSVDHVRPGFLSLSGALSEMIFYSKNRSWLEFFLLRAMLIVESLLKILIGFQKDKFWAYIEIVKAASGIRICRVTQKDLED